MILLYTDFGHEGPYVGQMLAAIARVAPGMLTINLMADAPTHNPKAAAYLLAALVPDLPPQSIVVGVVDPGVGSAERDPVILECGERRFVGPGNGLFDIVARQHGQGCRWHRITWRPDRLSASFHGRDLFAPVAAKLALAHVVPGEEIVPAPCEWPDDLPQIIYIDHFGNAMTGLRASQLPPQTRIRIGETLVGPARTFSDVPPGQIFWYCNSLGLVEFAANRASAARQMGLAIGAPVQVFG